MSRQEDFTAELAMLFTIAAPGSEAFEALEIHMDSEDRNEFMAFPAHFFNQANKTMQNRIWKAVECRLHKRIPRDEFGEPDWPASKRLPAE